MLAACDCSLAARGADYHAVCAAADELRRRVCGDTGARHAGWTACMGAFDVQVWPSSLHCAQSHLGRNLACSNRPAAAHPARCSHLRHQPQHQLHQRLHLCLRLLRIQVGNGCGCQGRESLSIGCLEWMVGEGRRVVLPASAICSPAAISCHPPSVCAPCILIAAKGRLQRSCGALPTCCRSMRSRAAQPRPGIEGPPRSACRCAAVAGAMRCLSWLAWQLAPPRCAAVAGHV